MVGKAAATARSSYTARPSAIIAGGRVAVVNGSYLCSVSSWRSTYCRMPPWM